MKKLNILRLLSTVAIAAAGVFGSFAFVRNNETISSTASGGTIESFVFYYGATSQIDAKVALRRGNSMPDGSNVWEDETMAYTNRKCGNLYVYSVVVYEAWGGFNDIYIKDGDTVLYETHDWTTRATMENKMFDGSSWSTIYTVDFNMNGHGSAIGGLYAGSGEKISQPTAPTASGYAFGGWYKEQACTNAWDFNTDTVTSNKTLFAKWTALKYTITYDRNLNDGGSQATQDINVGSSGTIYTPGTSPLNTSRWNPSTYKRFTHWNTAYDDKGSIVNAGSSVTPNASYTLYYIEDWYDYRYKINSGSWIDLVHNDAGKGEGVQAQFAPASAQELPLNGKLSFQYSSDGKSTWNNLTSITFEGNYNTTTGIELATVDTIYLKINSNNSYSCWVPGISDRTICVFDTSSATTGGTPYSMRGNGDNETVTTTEVIIEKGQFVRRGYSGNYTYGTYFAGGTGNAGLSFSQVGSNTAVECLKTGVYTVYNQRGSYNNWSDVYFTRNEEATAKYLAQQFNSIIGTVCSAIEGGTKSLSDLQNVWGSKSSTVLYKHFNGQFTETMAYFKTTATTSDTDILTCVAKYDRVVTKYGTTALPDFMGRNNGYQAAPQGSRVLINIAQNTNNIMLIVIISVVSVGAIGGYFFIRKRKEN